MLRRGLQFRLGARAQALCALSIVLGGVLLPAMTSQAAIAPPVINGPGENSLQPAVVRVFGTAPVNMKVQITDAVSGLRAIAGANGSGNWSKDIPFSDGPHTITAVTDDDVQTSLPSNAVNFTVDAKKPTITVTAPAADNYAFAPGETLRFAGAAGDDRGVFAVRMRYYQLDKIVLEELAECTDCNSPSAAWSDQPALKAGTYTMSATVIDRANNQTEIRRSFTYSGIAESPTTSLPPIPELDGGPEIPIPLSPLPGQEEAGAESPVTFTGHADAGSEVEAYETKAGLGSFGSVDTDNRGKWRLRAVLPTGSYAVAFRAIDQDGNPSPWSSLLPFTVDASRPSLGILTGENTVFLPLQPVTMQGRTSDNRGVRYVIVEYWLGSTMKARDLARCTGCPGKDSTWTDSPKLTDPGYYLARVRAIDLAGNWSFVSESHFLRTV